MQFWNRANFSPISEDIFTGGSYSWHGSGLGEWACEVFVASQEEWKLLDVGEAALRAIDAPMHIDAFQYVHEVRPAGQGVGTRAFVLTSIQ